MTYTVTSNHKTAIRRGPWELRGTPQRNGAADDFQKVELFDTRTSPPTRIPEGEQPEVRAELEPLLHTAAKKVREKPAAHRTPTEDEKKRLRALGYID